MVSINPVRKLRQIGHLASLAPYCKIILVLQVLSGLFSFIGLPMLVPVLNYIGDNQTAHPEKYLGIIENILLSIGIQPNFQNILIIAFVFIVLGSVLVMISALLAVYSLADLGKIYREKIFDAYSRVSWPWLLESKSGDLHFAIMKEVDRASQASLDAQRVIIYVIQVGILLAIAIKISIYATIMAVFIYGILGVVNRTNAQRIRALGEQHGKDFQRLSNTITTLQQNRKFFKTSLLNHRLIKPVVILIDRLAYSIKRENFMVQGQQIANLLVAYLFLFILMFFHKDFNLGYSDLLLILAIFSRIAPNFNLLIQAYSSLDGCIPMWESLHRRLEDLHRHEEQNGTQAFDEHDPIRFEKVNFVYPNGKVIFENLDLSIEPKKTTVFIGSSGIGKSTLLDLILGLQVPTQGTVFYGNIPHSELDKSTLRRKAAYVTQEVTLVDGTLLENLSIRTEEFDDAKIQSVLKKVGLDAVIAQMPQGSETIIGENGVKLSGGQRQRIAIGRALFMDPQILILDEATSNLDIESESAILETIKNLKDEFTVIIVTHRISSMRFADKIYMLEDGGISKSGSYEELFDRQEIKGL